MASTRSKHNLDGIFLNSGPVESRKIFLFKLDQAVASSDEVIN